MSGADMTPATAAPVNDLGVLARRIVETHDAAMSAARTAVERAVECGQLLTEAKAKVPHGEWLPWLSANTNVSHRTAQRFMRAAQLATKSDTVSFSSVRALLGQSKPDRHDGQTKDTKAAAKWKAEAVRLMDCAPDAAELVWLSDLVRLRADSTDGQCVAVLRAWDGAGPAARLVFVRLMAERDITEDIPLLDLDQVAAELSKALPPSRPWWDGPDAEMEARARAELTAFLANLRKVADGGATHRSGGTRLPPRSTDRSGGATA